MSAHKAGGPPAAPAHVHDTTRSVALRELLPESAFEPLIELMNRRAPIAEFKTLCAQHTAHLQARGVLPDYLAWMLYAKANEPKR